MPKHLDPENRIAELSRLLHKYNEAYFQEDRPLVSDAEYDQLLRELIDLEDKNPNLKKLDSPSQRVGASPVERFPKFRHTEPMLSLANAMDKKEFLAFHERVQKLLPDHQKGSPYHCELKFDGLSINLVYENGFLAHAATRGDGTIGEEVTPNVRTIKNVPLLLKTKKPPQRIEIRGEIMLPLKAFQELNESRQSEGEEVFANPRNAAAGSVRQLDSRLTAARDLRFYAYAIGAVMGEVNAKTQAEIYDLLLDWGFQEGPYHEVRRTSEDVWLFYEKIEKIREDLEFDIDGVVVKLNELALQQELGFVSRSPRSMVAIKFPPRQEKTILEDILIQVGRTGVLSPVAKLKPVVVHGVRVSRASLHNREEIERKDIRIGDWVVVQRAGDVIPEVVESLHTKRNGKEKKFHFPEYCPSCGSKAVNIEGEVAIRCINQNCPAQIQQSLEHFVAKGAMDIAGLGPKILEQLLEERLIHSFADLYLLKKEALLELEGFKGKSADNLLSAIEKSKSRDLAAFIYALGIRHVGEQLAKSLAKRFHSIKELAAASKEKLLEVEDVGEIVAESIAQFFSREQNIQEIAKLAALGIHPESVNSQVGSSLKDKVFVITGTLPSYDRKQMESLVESHGGKCSSSVSKKTSYIIAGENAGSKLDKAKEFGVPVLSETDFLELIKK